MMKLLKKTRGFTLIEVLVTAVILSVISFAIFAIMNVANVNYAVDLGLLNLQQQARQAMEWIIRDARQASSVTFPGGNVIIIIYTPANAAGIQYSLSNNSLVRQVPSSTAKTIAHNISLTIPPVSNKMLTVSVTASNTVLLKPLTFSLTQVVRLRNE